MAETVLRVEGVSKLYRKGAIGTGSLRQDLHYWWQKNILRKPVDFFSPLQSGQGTNTAFWALQDISFELARGEVMGIIGSNGAGKSTLLKILSRIIKPTKGAVSGKGKLSSLLEIGTGFHAELSGRENIFLAGYILGMTRAEIARRFDEIVAFSGVGEFIDTPIKRYSSGMYVRLAFAVAAHLEPDILIVDEVLAVGDIDFQKKCLGKMKEASNDKGRTILFVSHNMQAVNQLCDRGIWLDHGRMVYSGTAQETVNAYMRQHQQDSWKKSWTDLQEAPGNAIARLSEVELIPEFTEGSEQIDIRTPLTVRFRFYYDGQPAVLVSELVLFTASGECIFDVSHRPAQCRKGWVEGEVKIPGHFLNDGAYYIGIALFDGEKQTIFYEEACVHFSVADYQEQQDWYTKWWGYVRPDFPFVLRQQDDAG